MNVRPVVMMLVLAGGCRFDGGGLATGDIDASGTGDDDIGVDADPGRPDAEEQPAPDANVAPAPGTLIAPDATGVVTLDAVDTEFDAAGAEAITYAIQNGELYETQSVQYTASSVVTVRAIHDSTAIYFFIDVVDSIVEVDSTEVWNDDGIALYLDTAGDAAGEFGVDDHDLVVRADGMWDDFGPVGTAADLTGSILQGTGTYTMELKITKSSLGTTPGGSMGFDLGLTDDDGWSSTTYDYDASSLWFQAARPECGTCCAGQTVNQPWCDTTMFGTLILQ